MHFLQPKTYPLLTWINSCHRRISAIVIIHIRIPTSSPSIAIGSASSLVPLFLSLLSNVEHHENEHDGQYESDGDDAAHDDVRYGRDAWVIHKKDLYHKPVTLYILTDFDREIVDTDAARYIVASITT